MINVKIHKFLFAKHKNPLFLLTIMGVLSIFTLITFIAALNSKDATNRTSLATYGETGAATCTHYVAQNGNDTNPGTELLPWLTIRKAADTAVAGNTVCVKQGTYNERLIPLNSGSLSNPIVFTAYPGESVTIDGTGISIPNWEGLVHINGKSFITVSGLKINNSQWAGVFVTQSSNITIQNNSTYNTASSAILMGNGNNYIVDGNSIELAANGGADFLSQEIISIQYHVNGFEVKNNHIFNSKVVKPLLGGEGIDVKFGSSNGSIHHNIVSDVFPVGIYVDAYDAPQSNINVYNNIVNNTAACMAAAAEQAGGTLDTVNFYNNVCYNNYWNMFIGSDNGTVKNITVTNNTFVDNDPSTMSLGIEIGSFEGRSETGLVDNVLVRNNIISQNTQFQLVVDPRPGVTNILIDHNLIDGFRGATNEVYGTNYITGNPLFINLSGGDFHLQSSSPAIDMGISTGAPSTDYDGNPRPFGVGYDIGAYEYIVSIPTPTSSPTDTPTSTPTPTPTHTPTPTPTPTPIFPPGLSAYWKFDENTGNKTYDSSSNSNTGTIYGAIWTTGKIGNALYFNGKSNYVDAGNNPNLQITGALSLEGWVKLNSLSKNSGLFGRGRALGSNGNYGYFLSYYAPTKSIYFDTYSTTKRSAIYKTNAITNNKWHHIAATWDGTTSANGMKLYIDGKLIAKKTSTITSIGIPSYNFRIGIDSLGNYPSNAVIDEVKVYNRALSASEILSDYNQR